MDPNATTTMKTTSIPTSGNNIIDFLALKLTTFQVSN
jgi:hypothetical protein